MGGDGSNCFDDEEDEEEDDDDDIDEVVVSVVDDGGDEDVGIAGPPELLDLPCALNVPGGSGDIWHGSRPLFSEA